MKSIALAMALVAGVIVIVLVSANPLSSSNRARVKPARPVAVQPIGAAHAAPVARGRASSSALARRAAREGQLPQTHTYPSGHTARFRALMDALWRGILEGSDRPAMPAFFPKVAYEQLKAINGAGSDWTSRLVHDYRLDIEAAHALLGRAAGRARLLGVQVPASFGHWVPPGVCDNGVGYYEMPNARIVYSLNGRTMSLGIASMISWRGVWYVVHLGAILRATDTGELDDPSSGRGSSIYSGTC